jgi:mannose-1-phosphate guanylyltransferase/phosphomannomutase
MKAVIMAGGEGTRLRPLTCGRPKPMVPVVNKPVMEHITDLLKENNIKDMAVTLQYMPDLICEYFGDGDEFGIKMRYFIEKKPLGTAGSVKNAEMFLDETFLVISGDALTDINLRKAVDFHHEKDAMATLVLKRVDIPLEYGVVVTDREGRIIRFLEKPCWGEVFSDTVNTGIYILSPEIFDYIKPDTVFDFSRDLFPILLKEKKRIFGYIMQEYWCDIGDICAYTQAHADILDDRVRVKIPGHEVSKGIWIGDETVVDDAVSLNAPCIIGSHCHIRSGARIESYSVIDDYCTISEECGIKKSVVWKNSTLSRNVQLRGSIICNRVHLKQDVCAFEQSVIGENSLIGERAVIMPTVKIWPDKYVEQCTQVDTNLVWGSKAGRRIFGNRGVSGDINIEITPEFSAKLGAAYTSLNTGKGSFGIASDGSAGALMIKSSLMSGMLSSGVQVSDFKKQLLPAFRSAIRFYRLDGGVYVSACQEDRQKIFIDFLDKMGSNIARNTERKLENVFVRDDFHRCEGDCLKNVTEVHGFNEFYLKGILQDVKSSRLMYRIALHSSSDFAVNIIKDLLEDLGCTVDVTGLKTDVPEQTSGVAQFCSHVRNGGFGLGVSIEESCEKMMLIDERGRLITDDMFIALISLILFRKIQGRTVLVPLSASNAVEKLAGEYHGKVVRTKTSQRDIMGRLLDRDAKEELLDQFTLHFDAVAGLVKLLDYMSVNNVSLSQLVDMLPEIHMHKQEVECNWNAKGKVIRRLIQEHSGAKLEMLEGVKVYNENGWVLVLPDAEKPVCTVISEGANAEFAEELTNIYVRKVREISRS